ncbi:MAG: alpha/beta fold hydrolase [Chloroflexi bacterium]|nr:alpha/beta fold hydrolase [Chloroflexota bacterium]
MAPSTDTPPLELLRDGPSDAAWTLVLAHGAGLAMDAPFMTAIAERVADEGIEVVRFDFPYMRVQRATGRRRAPNAPRVLLETWWEVIATLGDPSRLVIGGKSMGGRVASAVADDASVGGLVVLGYPFEPPRSSSGPRTDHLGDLRTPMLICQGERDRFGAREEVAGYDLAPTIDFHWVPDGDHSFVPRKRSGHTLDENLDGAAKAVVRFIEGLSSG